MDMTEARPSLQWRRIFRFVLGACALGAGLAAGSLAHAAAGTDDGRPGGATGREKPPVRMLEQTLTLGSGSAPESLGVAGSWREVRAAIVAEFKPTAELITADAKPTALAKQLTGGAKMSAGRADAGRCGDCAHRGA